MARGEYHILVDMNRSQLQLQSQLHPQSPLLSRILTGAPRRNCIWTSVSQLHPTLRPRVCLYFALFFILVLYRSPAASRPLGGLLTDRRIPHQELHLTLANLHPLR